MVLVVDDSHDTCYLLSRLLRRHGFEATYLTDPALALDTIRRAIPKLVILDQTMPGKTGLDVFREMRADPDLGRIPVIFYSAAFEVGIAKEAMSLGASEWLVKGVHPPDRLIAAVGRVTATIG